MLTVTFQKGIANVKHGNDGNGRVTITKLLHRN